MIDPNTIAMLWTQLEAIKKLMAILLLLFAAENGDKLGGALGEVATTTPTVISTSVKVFGQTKDFVYTDDITNEDLVIRLEKKDFEFNVPVSISNKPLAPSNPIIYFSVKNNSVVDQNVKVVMTSGGKLTMSIISVEKQSIASSVAVAKVANRPASAKAKPVKGNTFSEGGSVFMLAGQTAYFKAKVLSTLKVGESEEFFLEAFGDQNGYGHSF